MTRGYHHGDLRNALIVSAAELIEESGSPDFAISDAAKRAGVSAAAPYRHFKDRSELLEAVSDLCVLGLTQTALETREKYPLGSRECIIALGQSYLAYVAGRPAFYNLMWDERQHLPEGAEAGTDEATPKGFSIFAESVERWCEQRQLVHCDARDLAVKLWAMAHGLAVLSINGKLDTVLPNSDLPEMLASSANTFLDGVEQSHQ